jgi:hypothetical protein
MFVRRTPTREEEEMSEQGVLFEVEPSPWVDRLWRRIDHRERRKVITILGRMALESLSIPREKKGTEKNHLQGGTDES